MTKKSTLTDEENKLLMSIESDEWHSIPNVKKEIKHAKQLAENTLKRNARINIRLQKMDLDRLKQIAAYEGLPYQNLISSVLHKFASGHLK